MTLSKADFDYVCKMVREASAIVLEEGKEYLVDSRLTPLARQEGFGSVSDLVQHLRLSASDDLRGKVVEAMTTNETSFFRDVHPFEMLKKVVLPELMQRHEVDRQLHLWCAASSSGQEPYTVAMMMREYFPALKGWDIHFIASDISQQMLARASSGCYNQIEINRGLPATLLVKYFQKRGVEWQVKEELRQLFEFCRINLAEPWPSMPKMDIIFMRNVLIYFDVATKKDILAKVKQLLSRDGYLFLGGAETTMNLDDGFERLQIEKTSCYRLKTNS